MSKVTLNNKQLFSLDSNDSNFNSLNQRLDNQSTQLGEILEQNQKITHQARITNMYKAHENDFIIDDNIFDNDDLN